MYDLCTVITNQELKLLCEENNIPIPEMGYWQKLKFNKQVIKAPIPDKETSGKKIGLKNEEKLTPLQKLSNEIQEKHPNLIIVSNKLRRPHSLVSTTINHWDNLKRRDYRLGNRSLLINVTKIMKGVP